MKIQKALDYYKVLIIVQSKYTLYTTFFYKMKTKLPSNYDHIFNCMECHFLPSRLGHEICNIKYLKLDVTKKMSVLQQYLVKNGRSHEVTWCMHVNPHFSVHLHTKVNHVLCGCEKKACGNSVKSGLDYFSFHYL